MKPKNLIVFDMDGVIIDVSGSYRDTVRKTAGLFFKGAVSWESLPDPLFPLTDLARVKQSGGLNNDWDLTFLVINLLFTLVKIPIYYEDPDSWSRHKKTMSRCDVAALAHFLNSTKNPTTALLKKMGNKSMNSSPAFTPAMLEAEILLSKFFRRYILERTCLNPPMAFQQKCTTTGVI